MSGNADLFALLPARKLRYKFRNHVACSLWVLADMLYKSLLVINISTSLPVADREVSHVTIQRY